jgi:UPF0716 protein FxsA
MTFRSRLLFFGYPLLEIATAYLVAMWIGWGWMLLLVLIGFPVGFAIMRRAGDAAMRDLQASVDAGPEPDSGRHALTFVGGLLIAIPGFWTDLLGLLLVLPPTQRLFRQRSRTWIEGRFTTVRMPGVHYPGGGEVIQGTVIRSDDTTRADQPPPHPPREIDQP